MDVYFPSDRWYDYYSGKVIAPSGGWLSVNATMDHLNLYIRGGSILPTQPPAMTTVEGYVLTKPRIIFGLTSDDIIDCMLIFNTVVYILVKHITLNVLILCVSHNISIQNSFICM